MDEPRSERLITRLPSDSAPRTPSERERLRRTFGTDAERYDRARPGYPAELFDDLQELACVGPGCGALEVGCGTGQATLPLAEGGCELVCVELNAQLATVARRRLAPFPNVRIEVAAFEEWELPTEPFDTVVAATAFHWIDPAVRVEKAADALRPGGALATIGTDHVAGGTTDFFAEVQRCYVLWDPATPAAIRLPDAEEISRDSDELERSGRFEPASFRRYEREVPYSTLEYRELLHTYSGHLALDSSARDGLLDCVAALMDSRYGGRITKRYLTELKVAHLR